MSDFYDLPRQLEVGGVSYDIRTDYRAVLDIMAAYSDPELDGADKTQALVEILYIDFETIPLEHMEEAIQKACWFIDTGMPANNKPQPRTMDWVKDAPIIIPEVNKYIGKEVRSVKYMHWWTFLVPICRSAEMAYTHLFSITGRKRPKVKKWNNGSLISAEKTGNYASLTEGANKKKLKQSKNYSDNIRARVRALEPEPEPQKGGV